MSIEYVYLIMSKGLSKIGRTNNYWNRLSSLRCDNPHIDNIIIRKCANSVEVEIYFLTKFAEKRITEDWFLLDFDDINAFLEYDLQVPSYESNKNSGTGLKINRDSMIKEIIVRSLALEQLNQRALRAIIWKNSFGDASARRVIHLMERTGEIMFQKGHRRSKIYYLPGKGISQVNV